MYTRLMSRAVSYLFCSFFIIGSLWTPSLRAALPSSQPEILRLTLDKEQDLQHFRTSYDVFKAMDNALPSREGLSELNISGSAQFSEKGLHEIKILLGNKKIVVIDLRRESHGFINGLPVSWVLLKGWPNGNCSSDEIQTNEQELLQQALHAKHLNLAIIVKNEGEKHVFSTIIFPKTMNTEQELCHMEGIDYYRIAVDDHKRPLDNEVDRFIALIKSLPHDYWLHFHCKGGAGRTTTFMALYDMMHNARRVSFEDIIKRQWLIGRTSLDCYIKPCENKYSKEFYERLVFLHQFYAYCQSNTDNYQTTWTSWISSRPH